MDSGGPLTCRKDYSSLGVCTVESIPVSSVLHRVPELSTLSRVLILDSERVHEGTVDKDRKSPTGVITSTGLCDLISMETLCYTTVNTENDQQNQVRFHPLYSMTHRSQKRQGPTRQIWSDDVPVHVSHGGYQNPFVSLRI